MLSAVLNFSTRHFSFYVASSPYLAACITLEGSVGKQSPTSCCSTGASYLTISQQGGVGL